MRMHQRHIFLLLLLFASGCLSKPAAVGTVAPTAPVAFQATATISLLEATTTAVTSTLTARPAPVVPTLSVEQQRKRFQELYQPGSDCQLPCWWGIHPGTTTWDDASRVLSPIGSISEYQDRRDVANYYFWLFPGGPLAPNGQELSVGIAVQNGIVQGLAFNSYWLEQPARTALSEFLRLFGEPDEIWLQLMPVSVDNVPKYRLQLFYRNKGSISMSGDARLVRDGLLEVCPQRGPSAHTDLPGVLLWSPYADMAFGEMRSSVVGAFFGDWPSDFSEIESLRANTSRESFYRTYIASQAAKCLQLRY